MISLGVVISESSWGRQPLGKKLCWDGATTTSDGWHQLHISSSAPARPLLLISMSTHHLPAHFHVWPTPLYSCSIYLSHACSAAEIIVIWPASRFQKSLLSIPSTSPTAFSLYHAHHVSSTQHTPCKCELCTRPGWKPGSRPLWTPTLGVPLCLSMQMHKEESPRPACVTVGSPSPPGMGSTSCQWWSTPPNHPTSLGCFFSTADVLTHICSS